MTDDERRKEVKEVLEEFRAAARDELKARHPELGGSDGREVVAPSSSDFMPER